MSGLSIVIPVGDKEGFENLAKVAKKLGIYCKKEGRGYYQARVRVEEPIDLYWLGANMVSESAGLFKGPLTT